MPHSFSDLCQSMRKNSSVYLSTHLCLLSMNFYLLIKTVGLGETVAQHRLKVARFHRLAESGMRGRTERGVPLTDGRLAGRRAAESSVCIYTSQTVQ